MKINLSMKINEAVWTILAHADIMGSGVWLRALETDCGTLYFVEHEDMRKELHEDYIGFGGYEYASMKFNKAYAKITKEFFKLNAQEKRV